MGLFRSRSTGLLRLGGALRDCCCRPQGPPPYYGCRCPSFVSKCGGDEGNYDHVVSLPYYGYAHDLCIDTPAIVIDDTDFSGGGYSSFKVKLGRLSRINNGVEVGVQGTIEHQWFNGSNESAFLFAIINFHCGEKFNADTLSQETCTRIDAFLHYGWQYFKRLGVNAEEVYQLQFLGSTVAPLVQKCRPADPRDFKTECCRDLLPLPAFVSIVANRNGISVNGVTTAWENSGELRRCVLADGGTEVPIPCIEPPWGDFLYRDSFELNLGTQGPCDECDCEADLSGRTVVFEGQSFSYGQGQDFSSYPIYIAEESPGFFKKIVYDDCDQAQQIIKVSEKTASVYCLNVDGEDKWAVLLVSICYERDDCDLVSQRTRTVTWDGIFNCGGDGNPGGSPEITLSSDINGTTGECSAALPPIPSITLA